MKAEQEKKLFEAIRKAKEAIYLGYQKIEASLMKRDEQNEELKKHTEYTKDHMNELYSDIIQVFNEETQEACDQVKAVVAEQREAFQTVVKGFYRSDGKMIDSDDTILLNSGMRLQDEEICDMVMKHIDNVTMLRLIMNYCGVNKLIDLTTDVKNRASDLPAETLAIFRKVLFFGSNEEKIFETFINLSCMGFKHPSESYTLFQSRLDDYEEQAVVDLKKARFIPNEGKTSVTKDEFRKMGHQDRLNFKKSNPELFKEFMKG